MKISEYPYGKPSKSLKNTVNWLNRNKRRLIKEGYLCEFDYPDYWSDYGLPRKLTYRLGGDEVDWLQSELGEWKNYLTLGIPMIGMIV